MLAAAALFIAQPDTKRTCSCHLLDGCANHNNTQLAKHIRTSFHPSRRYTMKPSMTVKKFIAVAVTTTILTGVTGCMGRQALTKSVEDFNLDNVHNRWGREGLFILLLPVSYITNVVDLLFINSVEFWTGKNPINHKGALVDVKTASLKRAGMDNVAKAQMRYMDNEVLMYVSYKDGSQEVFHATRADGVYSFYRGKELVMQVQESQLQDLQAAIKIKMETFASIPTATHTL